MVGGSWLPRSLHSMLHNENVWHHLLSFKSSFLQPKYSSLYNGSLLCLMQKKKWISVTCLTRDSYLGNPSFWYRLAHTFTTTWAYSNVSVVTLSFWCATAALFTSTVTEAYLSSNSCYDPGEHRGFTLIKKNLNMQLHWLYKNINVDWPILWELRNSHNLKNIFLHANKTEVTLRKVNGRTESWSSEWWVANISIYCNKWKINTRVWLFWKCSIMFLAQEYTVILHRMRNRTFLSSGAQTKPLLSVSYNQEKG